MTRRISFRCEICHQNVTLLGWVTERGEVNCQAGRWELKEMLLSSAESWKSSANPAPEGGKSLQNCK